MLNKIKSVLIVLAVIVFGLPVLVLLIILIIGALPFLTVGFITIQIKQLKLEKNRDKLKLEHKLKTNRDYLRFLYKTNNDVV